MGKYFFDPFGSYGQNPCDKPAAGSQVLAATPEIACGNPDYVLFNARATYTFDERFSGRVVGQESDQQILLYLWSEPQRLLPRLSLSAVPAHTGVENDALLTTRSNPGPAFPPHNGDGRAGRTAPRHHQGMRV